MLKKPLRQRCAKPLSKNQRKHEHDKKIFFELSKVFQKP